MSMVARGNTSSSLDIPKFVFGTLVWGWFIYRVGEQLFYFLLKKLKIPHVPKWTYDPNLKLSENMARKEKWQKKKLFQPEEEDLKALGLQ
ncbi:hypothetical protein ABK040_002525 [Willaertia magna]